MIHVVTTSGTTPVSPDAMGDIHSNMQFQANFSDWFSYQINLLE
jgi:hypothetical protein